MPTFDQRQVCSQADRGQPPRDHRNGGHQTSQPGWPRGVLGVDSVATLSREEPWAGETKSADALDPQVTLEEPRPIFKAKATL